MERRRIIVGNANERELLAGILIKNGYTVRIVKAKKDGKTIVYVEHWREGE